jgi:hypothetical protein
MIRFHSTSRWALSAALCAAAASAQAAAPPGTRPATVPTTRPATAPAASLETPRDSLKWFAAALRDGDAARLRKVVLTTGETEDRMIGAMADMAAALAELNTSAVKAFGQDAAGRFTDDTSVNFEQTVARIDAADVAVNGDVATVRYAESKDRPYQLRKVGAAWQIPASQFSQGVPPSVLERRMGELLVQARIVNEISREIAAGKYRNADAAGLAWRSKMMSALGGGPPGTGPATKPQGK